MQSLELPAWFIALFSFAFGSAWGSFANVVVYRWPLELSVSSPPSHCPHCKHPIRAYDNVPVLGWLWLRGKCRDCHSKISARYPIIELLFGLAAVAVAWRCFRGEGATMLAWASLLHALVRFSVVFALGVTALIDLDRTEVPNFVLLFAVAPLIAAGALPPLAPVVDLLGSLAGMGLGYFGLRLLFIDGVKLLIGRPGMGLGDAHLLVIVGALLGPSGVVFSVVAVALQNVIAAAIAAATGARIGADDIDDIEDDEADEDEDVDETNESDDSDDPSDEDKDHKDTPGDSESDSQDTPPETNRTQTSEESADARQQADKRRVPLKLPFAPFLGLAAVEYLLGADEILKRWIDR